MGTQKLYYKHTSGVYEIDDVFVEVGRPTPEPISFREPTPIGGKSVEVRVAIHMYPWSANIKKD